MKKLKILIKEDRFVGLTNVKEVLGVLEELKSNTWIFFDTETVGFNPHKLQLTEIAAIAIDMNTGQEIDQYHTKIELNEDTQSRIRGDERGPDEETIKVLKMTSYYDDGGGTIPYVEESQALQEFHDWINEQSDPMLIAHNAKFDMKYIAVRSKINGIQNPKWTSYPVIDTVTLAKLHLIPAIQTVRKLRYDPNAEELMQNFIKKNRWGKEVITARLGNLANAFSINTDNWHSAIADVQMLIGVYRGLYDVLSDYEDISHDEEHRKALKTDYYRFRNKKKKKKKKKLKEYKIIIRKSGTVKESNGQNQNNSVESLDAVDWDKVVNSNSTLEYEEYLTDMLTEIDRLAMRLGSTSNASANIAIKRLKDTVNRTNDLNSFSDIASEVVNIFGILEEENTQIPEHLIDIIEVLQYIVEDHQSF